jgi:hypothetical protein
MALHHGAGRKTHTAINVSSAHRQRWKMLQSLKNKTRELVLPDLLALTFNL